MGGSAPWGGSCSRDELTLLREYAARKKVNARHQDGQTGRSVQSFSKRTENPALRNPDLLMINEAMFKLRPRHKVWWNTLSYKRKFWRWLVCCFFLPRAQLLCPKDWLSSSQTLPLLTHMEAEDIFSNEESKLRLKKNGLCPRFCNN